jgi:hypothetical protein
MLLQRQPDGNQEYGERVLLYRLPKYSHSVGDTANLDGTEVAADLANGSYEELGRNWLIEHLCIRAILPQPFPFGTASVEDYPDAGLPQHLRSRENKLAA